MVIRQLHQTEFIRALPFVWKVFCEYEAPHLSESGKQAFYKAIHSEEYLCMLKAYGAYVDEKMIGIIATRNDGDHIALFFVDGTYQHQGIGRALWNAVLDGNEANVITVHSSLYAVDVYRSLGFIQIDDVRDKDGIYYVPMVYKNLINKLQDKDDKKAYALAKKICVKSAMSDIYYSCFDDFLDLIYAKSSYVRTRGFVLCCAQARWDTQGKLQKALPLMLGLLHDDKPTVVRQCLGALHEVVLYCPELCEVIYAEMQRMDLSKYKDSMVPLIQKDRNELQKKIA